MTNQSNNLQPATPLGIVLEKLKSILSRAKTGEIKPELADALKEVYDLTAGIVSYSKHCTTPESPALKSLAAKTKAEDWSKHFSDGETVLQLKREMLSGHLEGQALKMFISMTGAKRILEIGMFTGYSALAMAEALPEEGRLIACEMDDYVAQFAKSCFAKSPHGKKISVIVAPALESLKKMAAEGKTFDLVFIDADKTGYVDYFQILLDNHLLAENGWVCVDNTLLQGEPYLPPEKQTANGVAIQHFNQIVAADPRVEQVLLPLRDGLTLIRRKSK